MTDQIDRWAAVGEAVRERLDYVGATITELAVGAGLSRESVRPIVAGSPNSVRSVNRAKVSRALGWTPDSIDRILAGLDPIDISREAVAAELLADQVAELERRVAHLEAAVQIGTVDRPRRLRAADTSGDPQAPGEPVEGRIEAPEEQE